jgi:tetratricopeptide (TPR) repeat protein
LHSDQGQSAAATLDSELAHARQLLGERRAAEALMVVEKVLAGADAASVEIMANVARAEIMVVIEATEPSLAMLELSAALHDDRPQAQLELAYAYVDLDRPADAERCFKRMLDLDPASAEAHAALGALYLSVGIADGAEHYSRRALDLETAHGIASQTLAAILEARGEADAAAAVLDAAYHRQALFVQPAPTPLMRVLVLATVSAGNIPYKLIMPARRYTLLTWYMEHARAAEAPDPATYDLIFNIIGDADLAGPSAEGVEGFLATAERPLLNRPASVAWTRRDRLGERLAGIDDVVVPRTVRLEAAGFGGRNAIELAKAHNLAPPFLLRPIGSHGGKGLVQVDEGDGETRPAAGLDHYLTAYADYRSADGLFRKYRVLFVGGEPYPYHLAISEQWLVHHETSGMTPFDDRRAEEARFLADPEGALGARGMAAIRAIGQRLDLDYCGVDFSLVPDGRVLVFEANATMLAHAEDADGPYAHKNPFVARIAEAFQALLARKAAGTPLPPVAAIR